MRGTSIGNESLSESEAEDDIEDDFEDDIVYLRSLDPKEWKNQDHYKVLGLTKLRFKASDDQIKRAYRQKVLKHHPDKRRGQGEDIREDDDYFTCITKGNIFYNLLVFCSIVSRMKVLCIFLFFFIFIHFFFFQHLRTSECQVKEKLLTPLIPCLTTKFLKKLTKKMPSLKNMVLFLIEMQDGRLKEQFQS